MTEVLPYVAAPRSGSGMPVLIVHSWWGLTRSFTDYADRLADAGFLAGCADLFDGNTATTRQGAAALRGRKRREPMYRSLQRSIDQLAAHEAASKAESSVVGFSMGGHWAVWLAQHPPPAIRATVLYYAARAGDFTSASATFLAHYAESDDFVTSSSRRNMEHAIAQRGLAYRSHDYPGTSHWFAELDQPAYDPTAAEAAFDRTVSFINSAPR